MNPEILAAVGMVVRELRDELLERLKDHADDARSSDAAVRETIEVLRKQGEDLAAATEELSAELTANDEELSDVTATSLAGIIEDTEAALKAQREELSKAITVSNADVVQSLDEVGTAIADRVAAFEAEIRAAVAAAVVKVSDEVRDVDGALQGRTDELREESRVACERGSTAHAKAMEAIEDLSGKVGTSAAEVAEALGGFRRASEANIGELGRRVEEVAVDLRAELQNVDEARAASDVEVQEGIQVLRDEIDKEVTKVALGAATAVGTVERQVEAQGEEVQARIDEMDLQAGAARDNMTRRMDGLAQTDEALEKYADKLRSEVLEQLEDLQSLIASYKDTGSSRFEELAEGIKTLGDRAVGIEERTAEEFSRTTIVTKEWLENLRAATEEKFEQLQEAQALIRAEQDNRDDLQETRYEEIKEVVAANRNRWPHVELWAAGGPPYREQSLVSWRNGIWQSRDRTEEAPGEGKGWDLLSDGVFDIRMSIVDGPKAVHRMEVEYASGKTISHDMPLPIPGYFGLWSKDMEYQFNASVLYDGVRWIACVSNPKKGTPPTENKNEWRLFAMRGPGGSKGKPGKDAVPLTREDILNAWSEHLDQADGTPVGVHKGTWTYGHRYRRSDTVNLGAGLYLCTEDHDAADPPSRSLSSWTPLVVAEGRGAAARASAVQRSGFDGRVSSAAVDQGGAAISATSADAKIAALEARISALESEQGT